MGLVSRAPFDMEQKMLMLWYMLTFGVQPSRQILFQMLEWTSMNSEAALFELVTQPSTTGPPPSAAAYSHLMKACAWHGRVSSAQQMLDHAINRVCLLFLMQPLHSGIAMSPELFAGMHIIVQCLTFLHIRV